MHDYHIELARHALGLTNGRTVSYRMHFVAGKGHHDHAAWMEMVAAEDATRVDGSKLHYGGDDLFLLTQKGAEKALPPWRRIERRGFPQLEAEIGAHHADDLLPILFRACRVVLDIAPPRRVGAS